MQTVYQENIDSEYHVASCTLTPNEKRIIIELVYTDANMDLILRDADLMLRHAVNTINQLEKERQNANSIL